MTTIISSSRISQQFRSNDKTEEQVVSRTAKQTLFLLSCYVTDMYGPMLVVTSYKWLSKFTQIQI